MSKYLLIVAIAAVVYALVRSQRKPPAAPRRKPTAAQAPQAMVACAHCGVHLPQTDALPAGTHYYCCAAHREQGPA